MPQDVNPLLDRLIEAFPACFSRSAPQPLKIGLGEELLAWAGVAPGPGRPEPLTPLRGRSTGLAKKTCEMLIGGSGHAVPLLRVCLNKRHQSPIG